MRHEIVFAPQAATDLRRLKANVGAIVKDAIREHLRYEPTKVSRSRIKRLRGVAQPQFRLRVDDVRIFYDVVERRVEVLAVIEKADAVDWLAREGKRQ